MNHNWTLFRVTRTAVVMVSHSVKSVQLGWNTTPEDLPIGSVWLATQSFKMHQTHSHTFKHIEGSTSITSTVPFPPRYSLRKTESGHFRDATRRLRRLGGCWDTSLLHWPLGSIGIQSCLAESGSCASISSFVIICSRSRTSQVLFCKQKERSVVEGKYHTGCAESAKKWP